MQRRKEKAKDQNGEGKEKSVLLLPTGQRPDVRLIRFPEGNEGRREKEKRKGFVARRQKKAASER